MPKRTAKQNRPEPQHTGRTSRQRAFQLLTSHHTHDFITPEQARPILQGFGLSGVIPPERVRANAPADPKGLKMPNRPPNFKAEGFSVYRLMCRIADLLPDLPEGTEVGHVVLEFDGHRPYGEMLGRGSAGQAACAYIREVLKREDNV